MASNVLVNDLRRHRKRQAVIDQHKQSPCKDCGGTFPPYVMDFDHLPGFVKSFAISSWQTDHSLSEADLLAEIAKCDLVCSNCHRVRTYNRCQRTAVPPLIQNTHCRRGHLLTPENVYVTSNGWRQCKECKRFHKKTWNKRHRKAQPCSQT